MGISLSNTPLSGGGRWTVLHASGPATELFDVAKSMDFIEPTVRLLTVSAPTIVLGSSQSDDVVDCAAAEVAGISVVRRRSGGGAVWLDSDMLWVDVFVPAGDALWDPDVGRAMWWLGEAWADAMRAVGVDGVEVHRGAMRTTEWSSLVCFAGLGPGEVLCNGRKVVGISQRRTRAGALFQCGIVRRWDPTRLVGALRLDPLERRRVADALGAVDQGIGVDQTAMSLATFLSGLNSLPQPKQRRSGESESDPHERA